ARPCGSIRRDTRRPWRNARRRSRPSYRNSSRVEARSGTGRDMITRRSVTLSLGAAALGAITSSAFGQQESAKGAAATPPPKDPTQLPVVYSVPGMEKARVREGLVYKNADGTPLNFDVYSPASASRAAPTVILIHGGPIPALGARRWGMFASYGRILAA